MSKLKEFCLNITDGEHGSVTDVPDSEYYFLNNNNITDSGISISSNDRKISKEEFERIHKRTRLETGDVVIASCGTIGKAQVIRDTAINYDFSRSVGIIKCNKNILLPEFLYFYLKNPETQKRIARASEGAVQKHFYIGAMEDFEVEIPDIKTQQNIIACLSAIEEKISNNNAICSTLESMAKLLYDYWFVQFDFPDENGRPYKSSGGKMVWNEELKREIPEGWEVKRIGEMISTERGISYSTPNIETGNGVPMLNLATFMPGGGDYKADGLKYFLGDYSKSKVLKPYDLIMCNTQQTAVKFETDIIGRAMLVPDVFDGDVVFSHHVNVIRTQDEEFKYYLLYLFNSDYYHKYITGFTNGTNILGLSFSGVEDYLTEIPPQDILAKFGKVVLECERKKSEIIVENQQLASLRDFLLPMLMNGQVKVGKGI